MKTKANTITKQLQVVFTISIVILLISSVASFYSNNKLIETSKWVNHTNEVIVNAEMLISTVKDGETAQRGYLITNDEVFLEPYRNAPREATNLINKLQELTTDNPKQQRNLQRVKLLVAERFAKMAVNIQIGRGKTLEERIPALQANYGELIKGKRIMDELRATIEQIKKEENTLLAARLDEQETYINYTPILVVLAAIVSILITLMAYFRIKSDLDERVKKQIEDEQKYIETSRRIGLIEQVTKKISDGDYSVRSLDNAKDELGRISAALNTMVASLETSFNELEKRNWLQEGNITVGNAIRGERHLKNISSRIVSNIATYLKAQVGTLYTVDKNLDLSLQGTYAATDVPNNIPSGTGLLGQAVKSQEIIATDVLPSGYLRISSSIGEATPSHALIVPLVHAGITVGAIELGMMHKPSALELQFLESSIEPIAIGINTVINYERIQELLEETQAQSEELQSQHNELENINAELEAQTERLQASEEELRVQQEELQQANQELEERTRQLEERNLEIVERTQEVQRKAEELELSTKYKSEFLANMSHELRTPLNSILLLSRLLKENGDANLNDEQVEYAQVINSSGNGLLSLIDEILDLSKIEAGKMELEYSPASITEITEELRSMFEPLTAEKKIGFHVNVANDVPVQIETDKLRLGQVLKNLLSNAMKFTAQGSVSLNIRRCNIDPRFIAFSVKDTGIGIPKDKQQLIFEAFQQADGSTRRKFGGTGLGLSISREIAKLLGGKITLESEAGKGSEFTIYIPEAQGLRIEEDDTTATDLPAEYKEPVTENESPEQPPAKSSIATDSQYIAPVIPQSIPDDRASIQPGDKSILIVEDDVSFARSLLDYTRKKGYKGILTVRGDEGLSLAKQYKPIGVLLDVQLPIKSGWQVMEELKGDPQTRHIPVHMMSSYHVKKESMMKGAIDFINKPMAFEQMQQVFRKLEEVLSREPKKVLIVEENSMHAKALSYFLETFSVNTEIKQSIPDSVNALKSEIDCVILDMGIPDQRSYDMLEEVKNTDGLENLPIIIFTGKSLSVAEEQRIRQYADSVIIKTAHSYQRILDEVSLFLHLVEENTRGDKQKNTKKLGGLNEVLQGKKVLVVDDDVRNIFSLTKALEKLNMEVVTAVDGKEALEKLVEQKNVDVVLLDMMMPEMDGYETARKIRERFEWRDLPVIAVTAKAMTGDREKCIAAGASDYITKPVDVDQLLSLLRVWLYERA